MTAVAYTDTEALERKIDALVEQVAQIAQGVELQRRRSHKLEELVADAMPMARAAIESIAAHLDDLENKGYGEFARAGAEVVDQIVTSFSSEDVRDLGGNIALILETTKQLMQPDLLALVRRIVEAVEKQQADITSEPPNPPSLWRLARRANEPAVRRGLDRAFNTIAAVTRPEGRPRTT